jgi:hypothetical protein
MLWGLPFMKLHGTWSGQSTTTSSGTSPAGLSCTTIRGTQSKMENHPTSLFKRKDQQKRDGLNSLLLGLQQDM